MHNAGIMLKKFLLHNVVVPENGEKCMHILPATRSRMYKVDQSVVCLQPVFSLRVT